MDISTAPSYRGYRFPREIIAHCVWLYFRFCLSFRDIQEMLLERGVEVSYDAMCESARRLSHRLNPQLDSTVKLLLPPRQSRGGLPTD